jgi:uncharacterized lipoprotein YajG
MKRHFLFATITLLVGCASIFAETPQQHSSAAMNPVGITGNIGPTGIDVRWSNYGAYVQKLVHAVQIQFDRLNNESHVLPPKGTVVTIRFRMDKEGKIAEIINVESTGGKEAESLCATALTSGAPYAPWTDEMIDMLGESQVMVWKFYYGAP